MRAENSFMNGYLCLSGGCGFALGTAGKCRPCCWQRCCAGCSAASRVRTGPGANSKGGSHFIGDEVNEQWFVLDISFWLSLVASAVQTFRYRPPGWISQRGATVAPADSREVSSFSAFLGSLASFSVCFLTQLGRTALWPSLLLSRDVSQEIAKLILETKTVERGPLQMQPEYLPSNQLRNLIDAKAFS